jgi:hypothetical protein
VDWTLRGCFRVLSIILFAEMVTHSRYRRFVQYSDGYLTSWTSVLGGVLQTIIYGDFLYHYIRHRKSGVVHLSDDTQEPQIELHTGELESQSQLQRL